jgi:hypothetical protein
MDDVPSKNRDPFPKLAYPVGCRFTLQPLDNFADPDVGGTTGSPPAETFRDAMFALRASPEQLEEVPRVSGEPPAPKLVPQGPETLPPSYIVDYVYGWAVLKHWGVETKRWIDMLRAPKKPEYHLPPPLESHNRMIAIQKRENAGSNSGGTAGSNNGGDGGSCAGGGNDPMVEAPSLEDLIDCGTDEDHWAVDKRSRDASYAMELFAKATPSYLGAIRAHHVRVKHWADSVAPTFRSTDICAAVLEC